MELSQAAGNGCLIELLRLGGLKRQLGISKGNTSLWTGLMAASYWDWSHFLGDGGDLCEMAWYGDSLLKYGLTAG